MIEKLAKRTLTWVWEEMKENAARACDPLPENWAKQPDDELPGGSLVVDRLARCHEAHPDVEIHLVGHSAGSIFLRGILDELVAAHVPVASLTYLAAAIRTDTWLDAVYPHLRSGDVSRFTAFGMSPTRELDDVCGAGGTAVYRKSLLYLVSRAFERPTSRRDLEVPIVGMASFADQPVKGTSLKEAVAGLPDALLVWSPSVEPADARSDSSTHGGFDDDNPTMTSVLLRILRSTTVAPGNSYTPNLMPGTTPESVAAHATVLADQPPEIVQAEVTGGATAGPTAPAAAAAPPPTRVESTASTPGADPGNRTIGALEQQGWRREAATKRKPARRRAPRKAR
jgi:hypothetical protein